MAQMVVLSTKLATGYPQLSVVVVAGGSVMPGVHDGAPETALQLFPMLPPMDAQFVPLQQRLGRGIVWGVQVRLGAQPPVESQRHPWLPTMHVVGAPKPGFPVTPPSLLPPFPSPNIDVTSPPPEESSLPPVPPVPPVPPSMPPPAS
jgi:hypothetical protein